MMRSFPLASCLGFLAVALGLLAAQPSASAEEWGTVKGQVVFEGDKLPEQKPLNVDKDQQHCLSKGPLVSNDWVINKDNKGVRYAFVWLVADPNLRIATARKTPAIPATLTVKTNWPAFLPVRRTSLSNSLVNSLSRRADGFQAIILGGSPGM